MKGGKGRATDDKPITFRCHVPQIKEENTEENQMRLQKLFLYHQVTLHAPPKVHNVSHALACARQTPITFYI